MTSPAGGLERRAASSIASPHSVKPDVTGQVSEGGGVEVEAYYLMIRRLIVGTAGSYLSAISDGKSPTEAFAESQAYSAAQTAVNKEQLFSFYGADLRRLYSACEGLLHDDRDDLLIGDLEKATVRNTISNLLFTENFEQLLIIVEDVFQHASDTKLAEVLKNRLADYQEVLEEALRKKKTSRSVGPNALSRLQVDVSHMTDQACELLKQVVSSDTLPVGLIEDPILVSILQYFEVSLRRKFGVITISLNNIDTEDTNQFLYAESNTWKGKILHRLVTPTRMQVREADSADDSNIEAYRLKHTEIQQQTFESDLLAIYTSALGSDFFKESSSWFHREQISIAPKVVPCDWSRTTAVKIDNRTLTIASISQQGQFSLSQLILSDNESEKASESKQWRDEMRDYWSYIMSYLQMNS